MKVTGVLVILFRIVNCRVCSSSVQDRKPIFLPIQASLNVVHKEISIQKTNKKRRYIVLVLEHTKIECNHDRLFVYKFIWLSVLTWSPLGVK